MFLFLTHLSFWEYAETWILINKENNIKYNFFETKEGEIYITNESNQKINIDINSITKEKIVFYKINDKILSNEDLNEMINIEDELQIKNFYTSEKNENFAMLLKIEREEWSKYFVNFKGKNSNEYDSIEDIKFSPDWNNVIFIWENNNKKTSGYKSYHIIENLKEIKIKINEPEQVKWDLSYVTYKKWLEGYNYPVEKISYNEKWEIVFLTETTSKMDVIVENSKITSLKLSSEFSSLKETLFIDNINKKNNIRKYWKIYYNKNKTKSIITFSENWKDKIIENNIILNLEYERISCIAYSDDIKSFICSGQINNENLIIINWKEFKYSNQDEINNGNTSKIEGYKNNLLNSKYKNIVPKIDKLISSVNIKKLKEINSKLKKIDLDNERYKKYKILIEYLKEKIKLEIYERENKKVNINNNIINNSDYIISIPSVKDWKTFTDENTIYWLVKDTNVKKIIINGYEIKTFNWKTFRYHAYKRFRTLWEWVNNYEIKYLDINWKIIIKKFVTIEKVSK